MKLIQWFLNLSKKRKIISVIVSATIIAGTGTGIGIAISNNQHTHHYRSEIVEPTCIEQGYTLHTCACGASYTNTYTSANGHTEVIDQAITPTCTQTGLTEGKHCSVCNKVIIPQNTISASGHTEVIDEAIAPTCTQTGLTEGKHCSVCNKVIIAQNTISKTEHNYQEKITTAATCTHNGIKTFTCKNCYSTYTENFSLQSYSSEEIYTMAKNCAVEIITYDFNGDALSFGSGFVYTNDGQIITNYHVIEDACYADVYIGETAYEVISVLAYDINRDIAVLKIDASNLQTLKVCKESVQTGSTIYALGSSRGLSSTFSRGIITTANRQIEGVTYIQHDAAISNGNSGGPLINEYCEIIGINTLSIKDSQNLNFAIFTSELDYLIFDEPLTLPELYNKEGNVFLKLKNYILNNYDSKKSDYYYMKLGNSTYNGYTYNRGVFYYPSENKLQFSMSVDSTYLISIDITEGISVYDWSLYDSSTEYLMLGYLYPSSFSNSTSYLSYHTTNITYSSLKSPFNELAVAEAKLLCKLLNTDLAFLNISAADLGFIHF